MGYDEDIFYDAIDYVSDNGETSVNDTTEEYEEANMTTMANFEEMFFEHEIKLERETNLNWSIDEENLGELQMENEQSARNWFELGPS